MKALHTGLKKKAASGCADVIPCLLHQINTEDELYEGAPIVLTEGEDLFEPNLVVINFCHGVLRNRNIPFPSWLCSSL